ncbi:calcium-binding protein [Lentzea sp. NPDC059081]|uniref:calcium-binding protein n=1 Tax=Lentzea sp. NPDC059081 TaxID=3346719 RepID=UPI003681B1B3
MRRTMLTVAALVGALAVPALPAQAATTCNGLAVTISGTAGNDSIIGTAGDDVIAVDAGNDLVLGMGGNDTVCLGAGDDLFDGGTGDDTVVFDAVADGADTVVGDSGFDSVLYSARTAAVSVTLDGVNNDGATGEHDNIGADIARIVGGAGSDVIDAGAATVQTVVLGGAGDDTLTTTFNAAGEAGDDTVRLLNGGSGSLFGNDGNDKIFGGPVRDDLSGGNGDDKLFGGGGDDTIFAGPGNDLLAGEAGNDVLFGETGADELIGGLGTDSMFGGDGDDTADSLVSLDGNDSFSGGVGADTANYGPRQFGAGRTMTISLDGVADDGEQGEGDNNGTDVENVVGAVGPNVITGNSSPNVLQGGQSGDVIRGADGIMGNDRVIGGFGADVCTADPGDVKDCEF